jgi:HSP20 family protein
MNALLPRLFGDFGDWFDTELPLRMAHLIRVEDTVTEQEYTLRAEIPGLDPEKDVEVKVANGLLTIHAERKQEERTATRSEFRYGILQRTVRLPVNAAADKITARYDRGVLEVTVPLTADEPGTRQIPVAATGS